MLETLVAKLENALIDGDGEGAMENTKALFDGGMSPEEILRVMMDTMQIVGKRFEKKEFFLPDLILAGEAMKESLATILPGLQGGDTKFAGTVVLGTVKGDVHDIGKSIVESVLIGDGYKVIDLGVDVPAETFAAKAKELGANIVGASAYMATTTAQLPKVNEALKAAGIRDRVKMLIGGASTSQAHVEWSGADAWAETATDVVPVLRGLGV
ncbi:MAG: cobalamin B12-binding domain-containing protein [Eubacteriales bacterium]